MKSGGGVIILGWLGLGLGVWLVDSAVRGRQPIASLKAVITTGILPPLGVQLKKSSPTGNSGVPGLDSVLGAVNATQTSSGTTAKSAPGGTVSGSTPATGTHYSEGQSVPGSQAQWVAQAVAIMEANGIPADQIDPGAISIIIAGESGGAPTVVNHWDSNAAKGIPSKGIMQTIQSTFDAHALPGYNDVLNPVDNIIAATRYAIAQYGSLSNVPGVKSVRAGGSYQPY